MQTSVQPTILSLINQKHVLSQTLLLWLGMASKSIVANMLACLFELY